MRVKAYVRVGHDAEAPTAPGRRVRVTASTKPSDEPLKASDGRALPTVAFAIQLELPDVMFDRAARVIAELTIPEDAAEIAATVTQRG